MSTSSVLRYQSALKLFYFAFILPIIIAKPVPSNETLYDVSIRSLLNNKCKMPKEIKFPFSEISDPSTFDYLKVPLKECQMAEPSRENKESNLLCTEIFEVLKNITCSKYNTSLPEIKSLPEPADVCSEFKSMENIFPKQNEHLSERLKDGMICNLLCQDKFEILCQTLLWSYNVQYQLKDSLLTEVAENENDKTIASKVLDTQEIPQEPVLDTSDNPSKAEHHVTDSQAATGDVNEQAKNNDLNTNNLESALQNVNSFVNPTASSQLAVAVSENLGDNDKNRKVISSTPNENIQESKVGGSNVQVDVKSTKVESNLAKKKEPLSNELPSKGINANKISKNITSLIATHGMHGKEVLHSSTLSDQSKSKSNTPKYNIETDPNPETPTISNVVEENEFKNEEGEENESKVQGKSSDSEIPLTSNTKKLTDTKETNSDIPSKIASNIESSTLQISSDINVNAEQEDEQEDKDVDQFYNDTENEGDYSDKSEFENSLNEISKAKKPEIKSSVISEVAKPNELSSNYDVFMNRNNIGRGHDMQMVATFPEQEDGHFFFYFLSIVLILMAGYLIFHNKQKIIALIVEGRHERRRRSHGAGYKKLETK